MKPSVFLLLFFIIGHVFAQKNAPDKIEHIQSLIPTHLDSALVLSQELMGSEVDSLFVKSLYLAAVIYYYKGQYFLSNQYYEKVLNRNFSLEIKHLTRI